MPVHGSVASAVVVTEISVCAPPLYCCSAAAALRQTGADQQLAPICAASEQVKNLDKKHQPSHPSSNALQQALAKFERSDASEAKQQAATEQTHRISLVAA